MGLIYVNPEGPNGNPDPLASARDIRETFGRMAMNDEETVALIAGGHTFGKTHGAGARRERRPRPGGRAAWRARAWAGRTTYGTGNGDDTITSGLEVTWTYHPDPVGQRVLPHPVLLRVGAHSSPGGAHQWRPKNGAGADMVPLAHDPTSRREPRMLTTDLALRVDPAYDKVSRRLPPNPASSATRSPGRGSSSPTATWVRSPATSVLRCRRSSSSGRTRCPPSTTS